MKKKIHPEVSSWSTTSHPIPSHHPTDRPPHHHPTISIKVHPAGHRLPPLGSTKAATTSSAGSRLLFFFPTLWKAFDVRVDEGRTSTTAKPNRDVLSDTPSTPLTTEAHA
ncbi:hypothetical protein XA68_16084 [Ophiocordyceps unilateralis]|uniref:Uncharacterized protein n=1 Tax=Ophiocordyceps unilateralis TaxID=268505 RepID=A0A2A9PLT7_OPHUN|nr:hypothetical protein XA68_16084 [Ophiocordyceps unilateralis]